MGIKEGRKKKRWKSERERESCSTVRQKNCSREGKTRFVDISLETDVGFFNFNRNWRKKTGKKRKNNVEHEHYKWKSACFLLLLLLSAPDSSKSKNLDFKQSSSCNLKRYYGLIKYSMISFLKNIYIYIEPRNSLNASTSFLFSLLFPSCPGRVKPLLD